MSDVLFILKKNETYGFVTTCRHSSGLWNSTRFITESLRAHGIDANIVEVTDNNDIDRAVADFAPKRVVIEALWVVPEKFDVLKALHPTVKWSIHMHSHMPFLALEGIAMGWLRGYAQRGLEIIANSPESFDAFKCYMPKARLVQLPNVYLANLREVVVKPENSRLNVGCYGAVRPLKNHLMQALAAIRFAREMRKHLYFHVNGTRLETNGDPVLKNLRQLFEEQPHATLVEEKWYEPGEFIEFLHEHIDIGMQVSLSETFNVVTADYVTAGIPVVVSKEVKWADSHNVASDEQADDIVRVMKKVYRNSSLVRKNQKLLVRHSELAQSMWLSWANGEYHD